MPKKLFVKVAIGIDTSLIPIRIITKTAFNDRIANGGWWDDYLNAKEDKSTNSPTVAPAIPNFKKVRSAIDYCIDKFGLTKFIDLNDLKHRALVKVLASNVKVSTGSTITAAALLDPNGTPEEEYKE